MHWWHCCKQPVDWRKKHANEGLFFCWKLKLSCRKLSVEIVLPKIKCWCSFQDDRRRQIVAACYLLICSTMSKLVLPRNLQVECSKTWRYLWLSVSLKRHIGTSTHSDHITLLPFHPQSDAWKKITNTVDNIKSEKNNQTVHCQASKWPSTRGKKVTLNHLAHVLWFFFLQLLSGAPVFYLVGWGISIINNFRCP